MRVNDRLSSSTLVLTRVRHLFYDHGRRMILAGGNGARLQPTHRHKRRVRKHTPVQVSTPKFKVCSIQGLLGLERRHNLILQTFMYSVSFRIGLLACQPGQDSEHADNRSNKET